MSFLGQGYSIALPLCSNSTKRIEDGDTGNAPTVTHLFHKHQCAFVSCSPCIPCFPCGGKGGVSGGGAWHHPKQGGRSCCECS